LISRLWEGRVWAKDHKRCKSGNCNVTFFISFFCFLVNRPIQVTCQPEGQEFLTAWSVMEWKTTWCVLIFRVVNWKNCRKRQDFGKSGE
jgi:hypothetical protein